MQDNIFKTKIKTYDLLPISIIIMPNNFTKKEFLDIIIA